MKLRKTIKKRTNRSKQIKQKGRGNLTSKQKDPDYIARLRQFVEDHPETEGALRNYFPEYPKKTKTKIVSSFSPPPDVKFYSIQYNKELNENRGVDKAERGESPFRPISPRLIYDNPHNRKYTTHSRKNNKNNA